MNENVKEKIKSIFEKNGGFAHPKEILEYGINKHNLTLLFKDGIITRLKRGLYKWDDGELDSSNEIVEVSRIVPGGVICLLSALSYYKLTTFTPQEHQVAVHRKSKIVLPDYPPIKLFYFADKYFAEGVENIFFESSNVSIYCMEKSICDCFRYRNSIGKDILLECVKEYMSHKDRNIDKLMKFSRLCNVEEMIQKYVEVLI